MQAFFSFKEDTHENIRIVQGHRRFRHTNDTTGPTKLLCGLIEACLDGNGSYEHEDDGRAVFIEDD